MLTPSCLSAEVLSSSLELTEGWELASTGESATPETLSILTFTPVHVPGTVASALRDQHAWRIGDLVRFDSAQHWFRCRFDALPAEPGEQLSLRIGGIATIATVWLNGEEILTSHSMFARHEVDVTALVRHRNELLIACRPLSVVVREQRGRPPGARWRTRVVADQQMRWFRTTLLGRAPGFSAEPEPVGPWRPIVLVRRRKIAVEDWSRQVHLEASAGVIDFRLSLRALRDGVRPISGRLVTAGLSVAFDWQESGTRNHGRAVLRIPNPIRWWPHTHGEPALYPLRVDLDLADGSTTSFEDVPVGFRSIDPGPDPAGSSGLALKINETAIFCRGVIWTPPDVVALRSDPNVVFERLRLLRDGGFNLIRVVGTTVYQEESFHCFCDQLGLLVWQDMMFANMDYPFDDSGFWQAACAEAEAELSRLARHPSTALICGNSEVEQQVGMLGLDSSLGRGPFFSANLPQIVARCCPGVPYIPSAPCGGDQPFHTRSGIANYFGVGAYMRPLEDVRRAEVRFASECLAFANVPEAETLDEMALTTPGAAALTHPAWKRGIPRDPGAGWDFEDVRDYYFRLLYSLDPLPIRYADAARYLELSRMVSGEVMAEVFGEWRRPASPCGGGIVLWGADLQPGAGWGILDFLGRPKAAYWFLKRVLAPRTVWTTDEGLNGIDIHVANDRSEPLEASLRVALYRFGERRVMESDRPIILAAHQTMTLGLEQVLGRFVDASYAYRFGPPGFDLVAVSLHQGHQDIPLAQSFRFPGHRTTERLPISELGLAGESKRLAGGIIQVLLTSRRFAWGVRVAAPGFLPDDAYFGIEPGGKRCITLTPLQPDATLANPVVTAVNAEGRLVLANGEHQ